MLRQTYKDDSDQCEDESYLRLSGRRVSLFGSVVRLVRCIVCLSGRIGCLLPREAGLQDTGICLFQVQERIHLDVISLSSAKIQRFGQLTEW
jgi:hypothetical protein